jgi:hypothetical protein
MTWWVYPRGLLLVSAAAIAPAHADFPGGFIERPATAVARAPLTATQIQSFLPARGGFSFPAPYNTRGVRLTNASDCGGKDCVWAVGYSYWRNINHHVGSDVMYVFLGLKQNFGGAGPTLFSYDKATDEVRNLGPLFPVGSAFRSKSGEGWYFSGTQPTQLYLNDGPRMLRFDVLTREFETVYDVRTPFGADKTIWQMHSSDDDRVHSATLMSGTGQMLGCVVYREDAERFVYFPKLGGFNECHVDKSGAWLVSLENLDGQDDVEMRVFDLAPAWSLLTNPLQLILNPIDLVAAGIERLVWDQEGAVGHADMGHGYVVGSDDWSDVSNAFRTWRFDASPLAGELVSYNNDWTAPGPNHVSHTNARSGAPPDQQYACGSSASAATAVWANEVVCFPLDGSLNVLVAAPVMTAMNAASGGDSYTKQPKGNLDVTGEYFIWTSNTGGSRVDAFIVKVPAHVMAGGAPLPPGPPAAPPAAGGGSGGSIDALLLALLMGVARAARHRASLSAARPWPRSPAGAR